MSGDHDHFSTKLSEQGLRTTRARLLILSHLVDRIDHPTAEGILRGLRDSGQPLGPATLYQNLSKLADSGLITRITGPDGLMHFDATVKAHPHLACLRCGRIVDAKVDDAMLEGLRPICPHTKKPLSTWRLEGVQLELLGICPDCQSNN